LNNTRQPLNTPQVQFGADKTLQNLCIGASATFWGGLMSAVIGLPTAEYYNHHEPNTAAIQTLTARNKQTLSTINGLTAQSNSESAIKKELAETVIRHYEAVGEKAEAEKEIDQDLKTALTYTTLSKENINDVYALLEKGQLQKWDHPEALFDQFADTILSQKVSPEQVEDAKQLMRDIHTEAQASHFKAGIAGKMAILGGVLASLLFMGSAAIRGLPILLKMAPLYVRDTVTRTGMKHPDPNKRTALF
jgi:hypothetical protein